MAVFRKNNLQVYGNENVQFTNSTLQQFTNLQQVNEQATFERVAYKCHLQFQ